MNQFLRGLTPEHQVGALFLIVFGLLALTSIATFLLIGPARTPTTTPMREEPWSSRSSMISASC